MNSIAHMVLLNLQVQLFCIYKGDMNDPDTWRYVGESFHSIREATDRAEELDELDSPSQPQDQP